MPSNFTNILGILKQDMMSRLKDLDVVSDNLANVNTPGFKKNRANFQEFANFQEALNAVDNKGALIRSTQTINTQGALEVGDQPLEMAITGDGYFALTLDTGDIAYTRDGHFHLSLLDDNTVQINHATGFPLNVEWDAGSPPSAENLTEGSIIIKENGEIGMTVNKKETTQEVDVDEKGNPILDENGKEVYVEREISREEYVKLGSFGLTRFANPSGLQKRGDNLLLATDASGEAIDGKAADPYFGKVASKAIEKSNVDIGEELTHMISLQRGLQVSIRAFQQTDLMISQAIQMRR